MLQFAKLEMILRIVFYKIGSLKIKKMEAELMASIFTLT